MNGTGTPPRNAGVSPPPRGSFPGTGGEQWHRALTGRQAPEPVSSKLRMIYGNVVSEALPDRMLDLLSQLDHKASDKE